MHVSAIIAAAGAGRRLGAAVPKQLLDLGGRTILQHSIDAFTSYPGIDEVIAVLPDELVAAPPEWLRAAHQVCMVCGGARRQDSVANGFDAVSPAAGVVLVHDAARPFVTPDLISRSIQAAVEHGAALVAQPVRDTVKRVIATAAGARVVETLPRESIFLAQTPQAFRRDILRDAIALGRSGVEATDEAALAERAGHSVHIVEGADENVKITTATDLAAARLKWQSANANPQTRVGTGYDLHRLVENRRLVLGGVELPSERGALGHSDADVVCHAATDAILGAASLGDIGRHFPDTDPSWKDASSIDLLRRAVELVRHRGLRVANLDVVVVLERPRISPFLELIRSRLAEVLEVDVHQVSVKGKTNEGVDAIGRGEAIGAHAVVLLVTALE